MDFVYISNMYEQSRSNIFFINYLQTPDGVLKKKHFRAVIKGDGGAKHLGLKIAYKLTADHLDPKFFQKMHVGMAFEVSQTSSDYRNHSPVLHIKNFSDFLSQRGHCNANLHANGS